MTLSTGYVEQLHTKKAPSTFSKWSLPILRLSETVMRQDIILIKINPYWITLCYIPALGFTD